MYRPSHHHCLLFTGAAIQVILLITQSCSVTAMQYFCSSPILTQIPLCSTSHAQLQGGATYSSTCCCWIELLTPAPVAGWRYLPTVSSCSGYTAEQYLPRHC
eukprot:scpid102234/ scgid24361/ 